MALTLLKRHLQTMITHGLVPSILDLAYQQRNQDYTEVCDIIIGLAGVAPTLIPFDSRLLSLLESYIRNLSLPYLSEKPNTKISQLIAHIAQTVELQLLIDSNLLLTFFKFAPSTETLFSLIDHCVKNDRDDFLRYLFLVGLEPLLKVGKIVVSPGDFSLVPVSSTVNR
jgi:hypothetical protein